MEEDSVVEVDEGDAIQEFRVLAIDAQIFSLQYLCAVLHKCNYKVQTTTSAPEALELLSANKHGFDIVLVDVDSANMNGFKLLEIIGLEMYLPVIMVTADGSLENITRGLINGAVDYIIKPVGLQEIKNTFSHFVTLNRKCDSEQSYTGSEETSDDQNLKPSRHSNASTAVDEDKSNIQPDDASSSCRKKKRLAWTPELDAKFVRAVQTLSTKSSKVHPKRILEIMKEPGLTRGNVASHLQKYRLNKRKMNQPSSTMRMNRRKWEFSDINADGRAVPSFNRFHPFQDPREEKSAMSQHRIPYGGWLDPTKPYHSLPYTCLDDPNAQTQDFKSINYYNECLEKNNIQHPNHGSPYLYCLGSDPSAPSSAQILHSPSNTFLAPETEVAFQSAFAVGSVVPNPFPGNIREGDCTRSVQYAGFTGLTRNIGDTELVSSSIMKSQTDICFQ